MAKVCPIRQLGTVKNQDQAAASHHTQQAGVAKHLGAVWTLTADVAA